MIIVGYFLPVAPIVAVDIHGIFVSDTEPINKMTLPVLSASMALPLD